MTKLTQQQVEEQYGPLLDAVDERIQRRAKELEESNRKTRDRINQLAQPQANAQDVFGSAPGVRQGEDPMTSRGYSFMRALGLRQGHLSREDAKVEYDLHEKLQQHFVDRGGLGVSGQSILVPFGSRHISEMDSHLASEMRQACQQGVAGADPDQLTWMQQQANLPAAVLQTLSSFDSTAGASLLGSTQTGELIELVRAKEVFSRAGATELTLPPNGRLSFPKQTGAATAFWVGENEDIASSEPTTGDVILQAKKLAALIKSPNELIRFASPSTEAFFRNDLARVIALEADKAMLDGTGSSVKPKGLINYSGVVSYTPGTVGADGNTIEPEDVGGMISEVEQNDHDVSNWSFVMRPELLEQILNRRAEVYDGSSTSELGRFMFTMNRDDISRGQPARLRGHPVVTSTQVAKDRSKGSSTDLSYILGGNFSNWMVARVGVLEFATSTQGDTPFTKDQTWIRAIQHLDAAPRHEDAFALADKLKRSI